MKDFGLKFLAAIGWTAFAVGFVSLGFACLKAVVELLLWAAT